MDTTFISEHGVDILSNRDSFLDITNLPFIASSPEPGSSTSDVQSISLIPNVSQKHFIPMKVSPF